MMQAGSPDTPALRLGFGCSNLGSDLDRRASLALVEAAYDCGFRHFDVAPAYGHGQAERLLGEALAPVRDTVTLVTKAGIPHPRSMRAFRLVRRLVLPVKRSFPLLWSTAAARANQAVSAPGCFSIDDVKASVAESLRRLRTDRIDALLLHEVLPQDLNDELLALLSRLQSDGTIGSFGLGTGLESSVHILQQRPTTFGLVQVNHYWGAFMLPLEPSTPRLITHRWLKTGRELLALPELQQSLSDDAQSAELRSMLADPQAGPALLLSAALRRTTGGTLLVSSSRADRLRQFAAVARSPAPAALADRLNGHFERAMGRVPAPPH